MPGNKDNDWSQEVAALKAPTLLVFGDADAVRKAHAVQFFELLAVEGCMASATGARVRLSNGRVTVVDGPFTESKELIGGLAILQADSREAAVELAKQFLHVAGDGECELRQLFEADQGTQPQCAATT